MKRVKRQVTVKFVTEIRDNNRKEQVSFTTEGTFYEKNGATFLTFQEPIEEGQINTILKMKADEVLIMRSGEVVMRNVYKRQTETIGTYQSAVGVFEMKTKTDAFEYTYNEKSQKGKLFFSYTLQLQEQPAGRYTITVLFQ